MDNVVTLGEFLYALFTGVVCFMLGWALWDICKFFYELLTGLAEVAGQKITKLLKQWKTLK